MIEGKNDLIAIQRCLLESGPRWVCSASIRAWHARSTAGRAESRAAAIIEVICCDYGRFQSAGAPPVLARWHGDPTAVFRRAKPGEERGVAVGKREAFNGAAMRSAALARLRPRG